MNRFIAVLGGDKRYLYVIEQLATNGNTVFIDGFDEITFHHPLIQKKRIEEIPFEKLDAIVLPVLGMDEGGKLERCFPKGTLTLSEHLLKKIPAHAIIFSGTATTYLERVCEKINRRLVLLYELDDVAILNSIPTAEATLQLAMEHTEQTIHGANVFVFGYGRIGKTVAHLFHQVGANVSVIARKQEALARVNASFMEAVPVQKIDSIIEKCDICINTIPHLVITKKLIEKMKEESLIIDVASSPGGTDFHAANEKEIKALHALGLPGKVAPKTAGEIVAEKVQSMLEER